MQGKQGGAAKEELRGKQVIFKKPKWKGDYRSIHSGMCFVTYTRATAANSLQLTDATQKSLE